MLFVKKIGAADTVLLTKRYDWVTGTVYDQYDDSYSSTYQSNSGATNLADANFYVVTDDFNVYKCLDNNNNGTSTVEPTATGTETFELSDGYVWKFMYQIGAADRTKFLSSAVLICLCMATCDLNGCFTVALRIDLARSLVCYVMKLKPR